MRCAVYNPLCASYFSRLATILTILTSLQVVALPGTKQRIQPFQKDETVRSERILHYDVYRWHAADTHFSILSCRVSITIDSRYIHAKYHQIWSPPPELQGRVGAVVAEKVSSHLQTAFVCAYLPASGTAAFVRECDRRIFEWIQGVLRQLTSHSKVYLFLDANARVGLQKNSGGGWTM